MKKIILGMLVIGLLLFAGCGTITPKNIFCLLCEWLPMNLGRLGLNNAEKLLIQNPDTTLTAVYYTTSSVPVKQFEEECGQLPIKDYYRLEFEQDNTKIVIWVDKESEKPVCVYRYKDVIVRRPWLPRPSS